MTTVSQIIEERHRTGSLPFSVEMFPPKGELTLDAARSVVEGICEASPDFISVTCSAAGSGNGSNGETIEIAEMIQSSTDTPSVAHLTCIGADEESVVSTIEAMRKAEIHTVLALRGDIVNGEEPSFLKHASDLIPILKDAGLCVGGAAYPEGHIECLDPDENIAHLKMKQDSGADFFVTQLFFNNDDFYRFREKAKSAGIDKPILCGIMPFLSKTQIQRMVFMCGSSLPSPIIKLLAKYEDDPLSLRKAGIEYACNQLVGLGEHGVEGLHVYSMNHPDIACAAMKAIDSAGLRN